MALEPRLTLRAIRPVVSGLVAMGHDPAALLTAVGIDRQAFDDPDARVPMRVGVTLLARAVEETGDQNLGLHLAQHAELSSVDIHFYAMASSDSLGAAYQRLCRYQRLINDTTMVELIVRNDRAVLRHRLPDGAAAPRQSAEFIVASWVRAGRAITGVDWTPAAVRFAHPEPANANEHALFFRAPVTFGTGENALELDAALLDVPCLRPDPVLAAVLDRHASDRLEKVPATGTLSARVRALVEEELRGGEATAPRAAARLKMSVRTLTRQLAAEQTSFRAILDQLRHERASTYLRARDLAIGEVAFVLGFSDLSAFHRAFKRWTGTTPAEFRDRHRRADSAASS